MHDKDKTGRVLIAGTGEGGPVFVDFVCVERLTRMAASSVLA